MEMEDQYNISDLRQLMNGRPHFPTIPQPPELFSGHHHRNLTTGQPYDMIMMGRHEIITSGLHEFRSDSAATSNTSLNVTTPSNFNGGLDSETNTCFGGGGDGGTGRWPRQETLTLLEIRSRLDSKFKEANQKGPLWDEVSRIMCEEHGYQRSGKKCREKFENLYKYYKKTKEGKAGRQDGKHYRFFRQLEALYGETSNQVSIPESHFSTGTNHRHHSASNNNAPIQENYQEGYQSHYKHNNCDSLSLSQYSSEFDSSSSEDNDLSTASELMLDNDNSSDKRRKRRGSGRSNWRLKIKELIDSQMKKLMDKQEAWLEKLMKTLEQKERERNLREEEWRRLEGSRIDREQKFWARERAWIEARDSALFDALQKLTGKELKLTSSISEGGLNQNEEGSEILNNNNNNNNNGKGETWSECEVNRLIELRANVELKFQQGGGEFSDDVLWEDIATKMASFGFDRSPLMLKEKWESINSYVVKKPNYDQFYGKKRKENSRGYNSNFNFQNHESSSIYNNTNNNNNNTNDHGTYSYDHINEGSAAGIGRLQSSDGASPSDKHQKYNNNNSNNSSSSNNVSNAVHDACFPFLMGNEGDHNLWDNYGSLKLNKGGQN